VNRIVRSHTIRIDVIEQVGRHRQSDFRDDRSERNARIGHGNRQLAKMHAVSHGSEAQGRLSLDSPKDVDREWSELAAGLCYSGDLATQGGFRTDEETSGVDTELDVDLRTKLGRKRSFNAELIQSPKAGGIKFKACAHWREYIGFKVEACPEQI